MKTNLILRSIDKKLSILFIYAIIEPIYKEKQNKISFEKKSNLQ